MTHTSQTKSKEDHRKGKPNLFITEPGQTELEEKVNQTMDRTRTDCITSSKLHFKMGNKYGIVDIKST